MGFARETRAFRQLIWLAVVLALFSVGAVALTLANLRQDTLDQAAREQKDLAIVVSREIATHNRAVDHMLDRIQAIVTNAQPTSPADFRAKLGEFSVYEALTEIANSRPEIEVASLLADNGDVVTYTRGWPARNINDAHRDDFVHLSGHETEGTFVGSPQFSQVAQAWLIFFGRRLQTADGRFLGVAHVGVRVSFYKAIYAGVAALRDKSIVLRRPDGALLASYPEGKAGEAGAIPYGSPWFDAVNKEGGAFLGADLPGDEPQLIAVNVTQGSPVVVDVDQSVDKVLSRWRERAAQIAAGVLLALICVAALATSAYRHFRRLLLSEASLADRGLDLAVINARFAAVLDNMPHGVAVYDNEERLTVANRRYAELYGLSPEDVRPGTPFGEILAKRIGTGFHTGNPLRYVADRVADVSARLPVQRLDRLENGNVISITHRPLGDGGWLTIHEDVTDRQRAEDRIEQMAWRDQLTGLANRALLLNELDARISGDGARPSELALLLVDLDDFKGVNDTHGHPFGDALLKAVAGRLTEAAGEGDIVARIGGDEFALLQTRCRTPEDTMELAERVLAAVRRSFSIEDYQLSIRPSVGVARSPRDGHDVESLFKSADLALYAAKTAGRDRIGYYEPMLEQDLREARALKADLGEALARGQLEVHFQPIVDARTRRILQMEALARWRHPARGMMSPDLFIRLAEESGHIHAVGDFVLTQACATATRWPNDVGVSVNLSAAQLSRPDFVGMLKNVLARTGLAPSRLTLEITESLLMENLDRSNALLQEIRTFGTRIALDDFGAGYSSLNYLQTFALDEVKIDRAFIAAMETNPRTREIVPLIAAIARNLGFRTVAEGVETESQLELVIASGCQAAQGYYFSRPLPASEFYDLGEEKGDERAA